MSLKHLDNKELIDSTKSALKVSFEAEVNVLRHFQEIEERKLWTNAGSLYKYIQLTFGLTSDQIYPRIKAMQLMRLVPEVEQKLEEGLLSVTNALKAQQVFSAEAKERTVSIEEKLEVIESLSNVSTKEADKVLALKYPETKKLPEKVKPVAQNQNLIQFYVDDHTLKEIEELKARFSHQMPSGKMEDLLKILIEKVKRKPTPKTKKRETIKISSCSKKTSPNRVTIKTRSRHIPAEVKREMEKTRNLGCNHQDETTNKRCSSKHFLQMDHIHEYSRGGLNVAHNLQWLCSFHNRHRFETRSTASQNQTKELEIGVDYSSAKYGMKTSIEPKSNGFCPLSVQVANNFLLCGTQLTSVSDSDFCILSRLI